MSQTPSKKLSDSDFLNIQSGWSLIALIVLLIAFAFVTKFNFVDFIKEVFGFYTGNEANVVHNQSVWQYVADILNISLLMIGIAFLSSIFTPKGKSFDRSGLSKIFSKGPTPFYYIIIFEELIARFLFITVVARWLLHADHNTLIVCLVIGNAIWAALHYWNYKDPNDRKLLVVLPQFAGGIILGYVYIKYGFFVTLVIHLTYDFIVLVTDKKQNNFAENFIGGIYWLIVFGVSYWILSYNEINPFNALWQWVSQSEVFGKPTDNLWLMAVIMINIYSLFNLATDFVGLDRPSKGIEGREGWTLARTLIISFAAGLVGVLMILFNNWFYGLFIYDFVTRSIVVAFSLTLLVTPTSGSAMADVWFTSIPILFLDVILISAFGFWPSVFILAIAGLPSHISGVIDQLGS